VNSKMRMAGIALFSAAVAGGAGWLFATSSSSATHHTAEAPAPKQPAKYVPLDKVVVMLRQAPGESRPHYLETDLVLDTTESKAKQTKEELPLLRSLTVRELSQYTLADASSMTVEEVTDVLNKAFSDKYGKDRLDQPFSKVLVGKLIIE
jgi:flagellar protein FliL